MDLALELGHTDEALSHMTERDFRRWQTYAAKRMLPQRRLELYLAQIALVVAKSAGAKDLKLNDFMFDAADTAEPTTDDLYEAFGFAPKPKPQ